jgi:hypothetical protein
VSVRELPAEPGHTVHVEIRYDKVSRSATFHLEDVTAHRVKTLTVPVPGGKPVAPRSAEWIVERPSWTPQAHTSVKRHTLLSRFGTVTMTPTVELGGGNQNATKAAVGTLAPVGRKMRGCDDGELASPSGILPSGAFTVSWAAYGHRDRVGC